MKVFINFGDIRCVVPVGDGSLTVSEVILLAIERYRKAITKPSSSSSTTNTKIIVHTLKTCRDGAILDPDDRLYDVADDREQLIAVFDEYPQHSLNLKNNNESPSRLSCQDQHNDTNLVENMIKMAPSIQNRQSSLSSSLSTTSNPKTSYFLSNQQQQLSSQKTIYGHSISNKPPLPPQHYHSNSMSDSLLGNDQILIRRQQKHQNESLFLPHNRLSSLSSSLYHQHSSSLSDNKPQEVHCSTNNSKITVTDCCLDEAVIMATDDDSGSNISTSDEPLDVEITVDDSSINTYSANIPAMLHVRHGSEPNLNRSFVHNSNDISMDSSDHTHHHHRRNASNVMVDDDDNDHNHMNAIKMNDLEQSNYHHHHHQYKSTSKRWSTAIAIGDKAAATLIMGSPSNKSTIKPSSHHHHHMVSNYEHSDEDKSFSHSISPQSTKEEGYASEEQSANSQSYPPPPSHHHHEHSSSTSPSGLNSPTMFQQQQSTFARGSGRLSMLAQNMDQWADAADRQLIKLQSNSHDTSNKNHQPSASTSSSANHTHSSQQYAKLLQPQQLCDSSLGSMGSNSSQENDHLTIGDKQQSNRMTVIIDLTKQSGPLGIHVLPDSSDGSSSRLKRGLEIQSIEPGSRIDRDGRLNVGDIIIEIDGHPFAGLEFGRAQELFRSSLYANNQIQLSIIKSQLFCDNSKNQQTEQRLHRQFVTNNNVSDESDSKHCDTTLKSESNMLLVEGEERFGPMTKLATVTTTKKHSPQAVTTLIGYKPATSAIVIANTRRIGKKFHIQLKKGDHGLGFTITTRDNPAGGLSPIYIKTILPRGAAVQDGRLKPGDRLLEVCGIEMTGKSQEEAVKILRNLPSDSIVDLIVSRQEVEVSPSPLMPRQLPPEAADESNCSSTKMEREVMTFQIPLNDTGSAGLGISVKGKTLTADGRQQDSGIFIKSVLHGGAASKDGHLKQDDQLININGIPLSGKTNSEAMETLTRATIKSAHQITLTIARRVCHSPSHQVCDSGDHSSSEHYPRHQHESSILSNDSYDMSFIHPNQTSIAEQSRNSSYSHEDSFQSSAENTVIYSKKPLIETDRSIQQSTVSNTPASAQPPLSLNDSQLSLNDSNGGEQSSISTDDRFRRDGFGRQSMSEKRHAQLDAKTTDTYRRSKKTKEHPASNQQDKSTEHGKNQDDPVINKENIDIQTPKSNLTANKKIKSPISKNQILFSPVCCWKCQSPGSCPCRSKSELSPADVYHMNGSHSLQNARVMSEHQQQLLLQQKANNNGGINIVGGSTLRKSCSLESLQIMMQDLQKEQLQEQVSGSSNVAANSSGGGYMGHHHQTTGPIRMSKNYPSESFRAAVDRSYDIKNYLNTTNIHSVSEENDADDTMSRPSTCPYRVGGGHSMASTNFTMETATTTQTTTTNTDDHANLLKSTTSSAKKKKNSLFKNLFHFGSKKGRSKSMDPGKNSINNNNNSPESSTIHSSSQSEEMKHFSPDYRHKYQQEQERINAQYRKLLEEQKQRQQLQQQQQRQSGFVRNQLHPLHQSMPLSNSNRSKSGVSPRNQQQPTTKSPQIYDVMNTVGVPHAQNKSSDNSTVKPTTNAYLRSHHRIHPQDCSPMFNDANHAQSTPENPRHMRINSQEFYVRQSMDRPTSRVTVPENINYGTYGMINNSNAQRIYGTANRLSVDPERIICHPQQQQQQHHHYRQLSLRNPQHHRQISSPAATMTTVNQNFYKQQQPRGNHYVYEQQQQPQLPVRDQRSYTINPRSYTANSYGQLISTSKSPNIETTYGIIGQHHNQQQRTIPSNITGSSRLQHAQTPHSNMNVFRQQQPIYHSNQVQIYGTVYNNQTKSNNQPSQQQLYAMSTKLNYAPINGLPPSN